MINNGRPTYEKRVFRFVKTYPPGFENEIEQLTDEVLGPHRDGFIEIYPVKGGVLVMFQYTEKNPLFEGKAEW